MMSVFNTSAYKIITQSFYGDKYVKQPVMDLTEINLDLFIKTIIIDDNSEFFFIKSSLSKYKNWKSGTNLLLMEKAIEKSKIYIKERKSRFLKVNNRNLTNFNSVQSKRGGGVHT